MIIEEKSNEKPFELTSTQIDDDECSIYEVAVCIGFLLCFVLLECVENKTERIALSDLLKFFGDEHYFRRFVRL